MFFRGCRSSVMGSTFAVVALLVVGVAPVVASKSSEVAELHSTYKDPLFVYANGINNERDLPYCMPDNACNIIHQRFWFSSVVARLCRCLDKSECPWEWQARDGHTMFINPRAQLKFCRSVNELPKCRLEASWSWPSSHALITQLEVNEELERLSVHAHCYCPKMHYFRRLDSNTTHIGNTTTITTQRYGCQQLGHCKSGQFCGHITADLYQTYYTCRCPQHHLCLMKTRDTSIVHEALYEGRAYRGLCTPRYEDSGT